MATTKMNFFEKLIGSGIYTGYSPIASGTVGSIAATLIYLIPGFENPAFLIGASAFVLLIGVPIATKFEAVYGKDPSECTIDEFGGTWISLLFIPKVWWIIGITFVIWRILDILKPFPAGMIEKINGGWGIMLDDYVAGFYTFIIMQILLYILY
ncbi:MAG: phosphatidylglycerophosphatase A [Melioribacteraceae bacterium]|nr:phosphatidylglycerophosphatase A [Melioribacteraceae bacterium]MCF8432326.1 phosphatidylglycerophosphatase A [Melioribacteraceae bacterium]